MRTVSPKTRFHPASILRNSSPSASALNNSQSEGTKSYTIRQLASDAATLSSITASRSAAMEEAARVLRLPAPCNPAPLRRVPRNRPSRRHFTTPSGVALLDAPNLRCALHDEIGRAPHGQDDLDLRQLREWHKESLMIRKCYFVTRGHPARPREALKDAVRRCTWKWINPGHSRYDYNEDPVDDYIINRIVELTEQFPHHHQRTISIVSHDGGYADYLERFLAVGGYVAIVGILSRLSRKLYQLSDHPRVQLFDLEWDVKAVSTCSASPRWSAPIDSLAS